MFFLTVGICCLSHTIKKKKTFLNPQCVCSELWKCLIDPFILLLFSRETTSNGDIVYEFMAVATSISWETTCKTTLSHSFWSERCFSCYYKKKMGFSIDYYRLLNMIYVLCLFCWCSVQHHLVKTPLWMTVNTAGVLLRSWFCVSGTRTWETLLHCCQQNNMEPTPVWWKLIPCLTDKWGRNSPNMAYYILDTKREKTDLLI